MNKQDFNEILESALLSFDEISEEKLVNEYSLNPELAKIGVRLCSYLKSKELDIQTNEKGGEK